MVASQQELGLVGVASGAEIGVAPVMTAGNFYAMLQCRRRLSLAAWTARKHTEQLELARPCCQGGVSAWAETPWSV